jgi:hypothetical protein
MVTVTVSLLALALAPAVLLTAPIVRGGALCPEVHRSHNPLSIRPVAINPSVKLTMSNASSALGTSKF